MYSAARLSAGPAAGRGPISSERYLMSSSTRLPSGSRGTGALDGAAADGDANVARAAAGCEGVDVATLCCWVDGSVGLSGLSPSLPPQATSSSATLHAPSQRKGRNVNARRVGDN